MLGRSLLLSASRIASTKEALCGHGSEFLLARSICGLTKNFTIRPSTESFSVSNHDLRLAYPKASEIAAPLYAMSLRSFIHSGRLAEDMPGRSPLTMDYSRGLPPESGPGLSGRSPLYMSQLESNADVVHIKLLRNNAFVTLTDSKGNKKFGISAGKLVAKGAKRYSGEAAAEDIGRRVRQMKTRSVVVKVNGRCFFGRKKEAILAFKDGYTNSRGDMNPVVYLEDTTRKPHNGCRLRKKRRL